MRRDLEVALGVAAGVMAGLFFASRRGRETSARLREAGQGLARRAATSLHTLAAAARVWQAAQEPATLAPGPCEPTL
ncbi:MAG TPA: YtxH domain-containing protein [Armatimonadetes bacterium]|jgi:gas vesicle protein|nr:YtxH domain-containing protein [Armatimonadota bacterium]